MSRRRRSTLRFVAFPLTDEWIRTYIARPVHIRRERKIARDLRRIDRRKARRTR